MPPKDVTGDRKSQASASARVVTKGSKILSRMVSGTRYHCPTPGSPCGPALGHDANGHPAAGDLRIVECCDAVDEQIVQSGFEQPLDALHLGSLGATSSLILTCLALASGRTRAIVSRQMSIRHKVSRGAGLCCVSMRMFLMVVVARIASALMPLRCRPGLRAHDRPLRRRDSKFARLMMVPSGWLSSWAT